MTTSIRQLIKDAVNKLSGKPRKNTNIMFERNALPTILLAPDIPPLIEPYQVCEKLRSLQPFKSRGRDNISLRILREFAHEFAEPVSIIFNKSLNSELFLRLGRIRTLHQFQKYHSRCVKKTPGLLFS